MRFCPKCGRPIEPGASRCAACSRPRLPGELASDPGQNPGLKSGEEPASGITGHQSVRPVSRKHAGEWPSLRRMETLQGFGPSGVPQSERPSSGQGDRPIVPTPMVTVLGVPVPPKSSPSHAPIPMFQPVDVGITIPTGTQAAVGMIPIPAAASSTDSGNGEAPLASRGEVSRRGTAVSAWREVVVDQPPRLPSMSGVAQRDVVSEVPVESEKAYSGHLVPRHDYVPEGPPYAPEPVRAKLDLPSDFPRRNSRNVTQQSGLPKLEPLQNQPRDNVHEVVGEGVAALFYPLDGSVLGPSSSAKPHLGPLSSKPPSTAARKPRRKFTRNTWAVIVLIALAAGAFAFLQRAQKPRPISSTAPSSTASAVSGAIAQIPDRDR